MRVVTNGRAAVAGAGGRWHALRMGAEGQKPLWVCPDCGQSFVTPHMWHSCVRLTLDDFFRGHEEKRPLYDAFLALAERFGPVTVNVNKTRISFQGRVRFAGISGLRREGLVCGVWLKRRIESPRFTRVEVFPRDDHVYQFRLRHVEELDDEVAGWIEEASRVGQQLRD